MTTIAKAKAGVELESTCSKETIPKEMLPLQREDLSDPQATTQTLAIKTSLLSRSLPK